ncbi:MAG: hypothetical protein ACR2MN_02640 [Acidimicrobiales bacterium]
MPKFTKTVQAFLSEEGSLWAIVDALTEEMPGDCSASAIGECQRHLTESGIEKTTSTIKGYVITGHFFAAGTDEQRRLFRTQSATAIREFATNGATHERAVEVIVAYQEATGRKRLGMNHVKGLLVPQDTKSIPGSADPESWTDAQWETFDRKVVEATKTLLTAFNVLQRGIYKPSVEATAQLGLIREQDLDGELASLLGQS